MFRSRFLKFVKLKIFWEILHDKLDVTNDPAILVNKRKKAAFVELQSVQDFEKVLKWYDLFLGPSFGKIEVNVGNFADFKTYNDLNQKIAESDDPSIPFTHKRESRFGNGDASSNGHPGQSKFYHGSPESENRPLHREPLHPHSHPNTQVEPKELPPLIQPKPAQVSKKSNPFGSAKPVDVLSKQIEIEKKLEALAINKTTFRTVGHDDEDQEKPKTEKPVKESKPTPASTGTKESSATQTPSSRSKPSTPSHTHLKLNQPNSPKKKLQQPELRPALKPEVEAWKPLPSSTVANHLANTEVNPPPSNPSQLHPSDPIPVSASVFQSKKSSQSEKQPVDKALKRRVLLKRKVPEHQKKAEETRHIVRRDSSSEKRPDDLQNTFEPAQKLPETVVDDEVKEPVKGKRISEERTKRPAQTRRKSPKGQDDKVAAKQSKNSTPESEVEATAKTIPEKKRFEKTTEENIPKPPSSVDKFGRTIFNNVSYTKDSKKEAEKKNEDIGTNTTKEIAEDSKAADKPTEETSEKPVENQEITETGETTSFRGRGRGRGRARGRGLGRGRGAPFRSRRDNTDDTDSRSKSPEKKSQESKPKSPKDKEPAISEPKAPSDTAKVSTEPTSQGSESSSTTERPSRGRGGFRGRFNRPRRGKDGLFHNMSRTFSNPKEKPAAEKGA